MKVTENNQGYSIIERFHIGAQGFVLGENPNAPQPYVTWQCRTDAPNHFFWGHYFSEKEKAYRDYEERIRQEVEHIEQKAGKSFSIPPLCLSIEPSSGDLINIKRGISGYFPSDWNRPGEREYNRRTADFANEGLHVSRAQEAAMLHGSMFGWGCPAANPKDYDDEGKMLVSQRRDELER